MSIFSLVKSSKFVATTAALVGVATVASANPSHAIAVASSGYETIGDVTVSDGGVSMTASGVADFQLESFLGLEAGSLDALNSIDVTNGSAIKKTVKAKAGDKISFDWFFQAGDYAPFNDFSFFTVGSTVSTLASVLQVGNYGQASSQSFYTFTEAGEYTVGVGVVNAIDQGLSSSLKISNVASSSQAVPEPASILGILAVSAIGGTSIQKRKKQQKTATLV